MIMKIFIKYITSIKCMLVAALAFMVAACTEGPAKTEVLSVSVEPESLELLIGESSRLSAETEPAGEEVSWASSDENIAIVDASGRVLAKEKGSADITVSAGGKTAVCKVNVVGIPVDNVILSKSSLELTIGESATLTATVLPADADSRQVFWSSSDEAIVTVDENGNVSSVGIGQADIIARAGNMEAECHVTVSGIAADSVAISKTSLGMRVGETSVLTAYALPKNVSDGTVEWKSSNPAVASVDDDGLVTAVKIGIATITARVGDAKAECLVSVMGDPVVGDYYYSDGTYSTTLYSSKTPIGVIFWTGDPTQDDESLRRDHPDCTHGLVVSLEETTVQWQRMFGCIGEWVKENPIDYISPVTTTDGSEPDYMNKIMGYNNTKAIEIFNEAEPEAMCEAVNKTVVYRLTNSAPESSSDWYLPSAKELTLMSGGEYDGNIWDMYMDVPLNERTDIFELINSRLSRIPEATELSEQFYWSSSEEDAYYAFYIYFAEGSLSRSAKGNTNRARFVLAF